MNSGHCCRDGGLRFGSGTQGLQTRTSSPPETAEVKFPSSPSTVPDVGEPVLVAVSNTPGLDG